ncbi:MAG: class I SAM-dependent RNA methyltransferase [Bacteroidota bacterium]
MKSPANNTILTITLKTFFGLEEVVIEELKELGYEEGVVALNRAVQLKGTWKDVYFLNLHCRCVITVLVQIAEFDLRQEEDLYKQAMKIDWASLFSVDKTFAVKGAVFSDLFKHSQYPFLLVKDAIVDAFRKQTGERPNVNVKSPQVLFDLYIREKKATISLNTSGTPLFQRGYRENAGEAPLNEVVAAGLIRMSGWDRKSTFVDPFCGSGTFLIEAAFLATGIPSNIERQHYAFKNLKNYNAELWTEIYEASQKRITALPCKIIGGDINDEMILKTRRNLRALPFGRFVETKSGPFEQFTSEGESGVMISNPPYGIRMGDNIEEMYDEIGTWMKHSMSGYACWILSSSEEGLKALGLKPDKKFKVYNGELECSFRKFSVYDGSKKASKMEVDN